MSVIFIVVPLALLMAGLGVWAFIAAARAGQFDDLDTPALRVLSDGHAAERVDEKTRPARGRAG